MKICAIQNMVGVKPRHVREVSILRMKHELQFKPVLVNGLRTCKVDKCFMAGTAEGSH